MGSGLVRFVCGIIFVLMAIFLVACGESIPKTENLATSDTIQSSKTSTFARGIRVEGAWSTPDMIGSEVSEDYLLNIFMGPKLNLDNSGIGFASWRFSGVAAETGVYSSKTMLLRRDLVDDGSGWVDQSQQLNLGTGLSSFPEIKIHPASGIAYALWLNSGHITLRMYHPQSDWGNVIAIAANRFPAQLFVDVAGNAVVHWLTRLSPEEWALSVRTYSVDGQLSPVKPLIRTPLNADDVMSLSNIRVVSHVDDQILFAWQEDVSSNVTNSVTASQLSSAFYHSQNGWAATKKIADLPAGVHLEALVLATDLTTGNVELVFTQRASASGSASLAASYNQRSGFWSPRMPIDNATFVLHQNAVIATNQMGEMLIAWSELSLVSTGQVSRIMVRQFSPQDSWGNIINISDSLPFVPSGSGVNLFHLDNPQVALNDNGRATVAWFDHTQTHPEIYVNHFWPSAGWGTQELVAMSQAPEVHDMVVHLDADNKCAIVWRDVVPTLLGEQHRIWLSSHTAMGAPSQPPNNGQNPLPSPDLPLNHAQFASDCVSCHNGVTSIGQSSFHIPTTGACESCHMALAWRPIFVVDHTQVLGACVNCHNGLIAQGKGVTHIESPEQCDLCHSNSAWLPAIGIGSSSEGSGVDHTQVVGTCFSCHNGLGGSGKSVAHIVASDRCETCHSTAIWIPVVVVDHSQVMGGCEDCHNGVMAMDKPISHIMATGQCNTCHSTVVWQPVIVVDHNEVLGACRGCHALPALHQSIPSGQDCAECHSTMTWLDAKGK